MRVIAGEFRSRVLKSVPGLDVRPTPDRLRETLFNILAPRIAGSVFLDAYAGSGSVGIEALSRGAKRAIFIENAKEAIGVIESNLAALQVKERATLLRGTVRKKLEPGMADLVFLDPPYPLHNEYGAVLSLLGQTETRAQIVIAQHSRRCLLEERYGRLHRYRMLIQGDNVLSLFEPRPLQQPELNGGADAAA